MSEQLTEEEKTYCHFHPDVETNVRCSNCGKPICTDDMVFSSVGIKCKECARPIGRMMSGPRPIYYLRGALAGLGTALVGGIALFILRTIIPFGGFIFAMALGYVIGEAISWAGRRNTGVGMQIIAGISAFLAFTLGGYLFGPVLRGIFYLSLNPFGLLLSGIGIFIAVARLKE